MTPPEPIFQRRKNPTKRRSRTRISSPSSPTSGSPPAAPVVPNPTHKSAASLRAAPPSRRRKGLLAPPTIPGYETIPTSQSPRERYTPAAIARLKAQGNCLPPALTDQGDEMVEEPRRDESSDERVDAAQRALREAKVGERSVRFSDSGTKELRGAPGRPDPFSAAWRGGLMRTENVEDDGDAMVVDDFAGVDNEAYTLERDAIMTTADTVGDEEEDGSDGEWELEQLRRAGQRMGRDGDKMSEQLARRVVRAADEEGRRSGAVAACLRVAREARGEWKMREELAEGKLQKLGDVERGGEAAARQVERDIETKKRRLVFYDALSAHVDDVTDMLKEKEAEIIAARTRFFAGLQAEAARVRQSLTGGCDEFGRSRPPSLDLPEPEGDDGEDVFSDVTDDVRSIATLARLFRRWRVEYPDEYEKAFGDSGLGKLAARLALALPDAELRWARVLDGQRRAEALRAIRAAETVAAAIRARWRPREIESCENFAKLAREAGEACGKEGTNAMVAAFRERATLEMEGCGKVGDARQAGRCLVGAVRVMTILRCDVGIAGLLKMMEEGGWEWGVWDGKTMEALRWIVEDAKNVVEEESVRVASRVFGSLKGGANR